VGIIVMTGGTSGLGAVAVRRFVAARETVILGVRGAAPPGTESIALDLTQLDQVRAFAAKVEHVLGDRAIDALVLNAGGYGHGRTREGYDGTLVVNHLAHYLLAQLLWRRIAQRGRVVLTTSGTHDPAERTIIPPPRHANVLWLAKPENDPELDADPAKAARRAYASAKLCVVLHACALAARADTSARAITVIAYDPGPTPGTGLARDLPRPARFMWESLPGLVRLFMRGANTVEGAGEALAELVMGKERPPAGRVYVALRRGKLTWRDPSELARRDELMSALDRDSASLVALPARA
jgi:NAD(P)-dependent dehydrogenase (short-subunit alcohol dehydrogenase family)